MRIFHGALERYLRQLPVELVVESIDAKLKAKGVELSQAERGRLTAELKSGTAELIIRSGTQSDPMREVEIEWSAEDVVDLQGRSDRLVASIPALVPGLADEMAEWMLGLALKKWPSRRRRRRREMRCFQRALVNEWQEALSKLEILIDMAQEAGREALAELQKEEDDPALCLHAVVFRLQARACQVSNEILTLLRAGFADGAMARWRTLHEIAVTTTFICEAGEDAAARYVAHEVVEARRAAKNYDRCQERLGYEPLDQQEIDEIEAEYREAIERFGKPFGGDYGWAAAALGIDRPTFRDVEDHASLDHLRSHFQMASHNVHANPRGLYFRLGLLDEEDVLLTGPSTIGLADPGSATAVSLVQATAPVLNLSPTLDELVILSLLLKYSREVSSAFGDGANTSA